MTSRFLCDAMLGRLARDLRILGYDAAYAGPTETDAAVLTRAIAEERLLLTKDKMLARTAGARGLLLESPDEIAEVVTRLSLRPRRADFFSRCTACGARLEAAPPGSPGVPAHLSRASSCPSCGHFYWEGSHVGAIVSRLGRFVVDEADRT